MCSDTSTSGTDDHQEVFEELADKYRFQVILLALAQAYLVIKFI